jgi:beta-fructofuranosidase
LSCTSVYYDSNDENVIIDRSLVPVTSPSVCLAPEIAPFSLFTQWNAESNQDVEETLNIRAFCDASVLEVFVNERVAITTRIYSEIKACTGIIFFAHGSAAVEGAEVAEVSECQVWDAVGCK